MDGRPALFTVLMLVSLVACGDDDGPGEGPSIADGDDTDEVVDAGTRDAAAAMRDSDGDGILDWMERPGGADADTDRDGTPNHLDDDDDGDGIPTAEEGDADADADGTPDFLDDDDDGDGIPTAQELVDGQPVDSDGDGTPDHLDRDPASGGTECAQASDEADVGEKPVDVIFVIDNSGSMTKEIEGVQSNISTAFASAVEQAETDYRVIMITTHGPLNQESVCITGALNPEQDCEMIRPGRVPVLNPPIFYHYSVEIGSDDAWCQLLDTYDEPDNFNLAPGGWKEWLRPQSRKVFVVVTDGRPNCTLGDLTLTDENDIDSADRAADDFDVALTSLDRAQFGTPGRRNYVWHSIVGLTANEPADAPWTPADPIQSAVCTSSSTTAVGYQALSSLTGGLRFPVCEGFNFDALFAEIASGVIATGGIQCNFAVPDAPEGEALDLSTVEAVYSPSEGDVEEIVFREVADEDACGDNGADFYFDGDSTIRLCPLTCRRVRADASAQVEVRFGCELPPPPEAPPPPGVE